MGDAGHSLARFQWEPTQTTECCNSFLIPYWQHHLLHFQPQAIGSLLVQALGIGPPLCLQENQDWQPATVQDWQADDIQAPWMGVLFKRWHLLQRPGISALEWSTCSGPTIYLLKTTVQFSLKQEFWPKVNVLMLWAKNQQGEGCATVALSSSRGAATQTLWGGSLFYRAHPVLHLLTQELESVCLHLI